jgi:SHS2 domain-containing protein
VYRFTEHGDELELEVEASSDADVIEEATAALAELLRGDEIPSGEAVTREVTVDADDRAQLLAAWLQELVFLAEDESLITASVRFESLDERGLRARVEGHRGRAPHAVWAVTYHRLAFDRRGDGWAATVVLAAA